MKRIAVTVTVLFCLILSGVWIFRLEPMTRVDPARLRFAPCRVFYDRNGRMLDFEPDKSFRRHVWVPLQSIPQKLREAFIAAEDRRFFSHHGVDFKALARAAFDSALKGRIVSGASTITEQLVRLAYPHRRTFAQKFIEMVRAVRLERILDKKQILALYLNRVPMGNNLYGVQTASKFYFGVGCGQLSVARSALLASIPKAPSLLNPYGPNLKKLLARKDWVLSRMRKLGFITATQFARAKQKQICFLARRFPMDAPNFVNMLKGKKLPGETNGAVYTTLDLPLQRHVEEILASHRVRLAARGATQAAAIVLSNARVSVLALAGSIEYSARDGGFNNGVLARRSPGSALKPFLYALALDSGLTSSTVLYDVNKSYRFAGGNYTPLNYDRVAYGPVLMRDALANSMNLSAVWLLHRIGIRPFYDVLQKLRLIARPGRGPRYYGLGMAIGNPDVDMLDVAQAYACLANGGIYRRARMWRGEPQSRPERIYSPQAAWIVSNMLSDPAARSLEFGHTGAMMHPYGIAIKTGTSTDYRDCWTAAYTRDYTVVVWVGNFNGSPTNHLSGAGGAAPIVSDILSALYPLSYPLAFPRPPGVVERKVCSFSGMLPGPFCPEVRNEWFIAGREPDRICTYHVGTDAVHRLPDIYAGWLNARFERGRQGRYRLQGFSSNLSTTFAPRANASSAPPLARGLVTIAPRSAIPPLFLPRDCTISIVSPLDGDRFVIDPSRKRQSIEFSAVADKPVPDITWFVNGVQYAVSPPPYTVRWRLERGRYTITAVTPQNTAASIRIRVD